jgi:hypothetical protein
MQFVVAKLPRNNSMRLIFLGCLLLPSISMGMEAKSCAQSTELECIQSTKCTLIQTGVHGNYVCRDSVGRCETGFRQVADYDIQKDCESKPGCEFKAANCFCPPKLNCTCGGGPPAQCVERSKSK